MSDLRASLLKANKFRSKIIDLEIPSDDGPATILQVKIKQPTVDERNAIFAETRVGKGGETSVGSAGRSGALCIIHCTRHPDTDEPVFTAADLDTLLGCPAGGWVDKLSGEIMTLLAETHTAAKK